jgi:hypothetical protein
MRPSSRPLPALQTAGRGGAAIGMGGGGPLPMRQQSASTANSKVGIWESVGGVITDFRQKSYFISRAQRWLPGCGARNMIRGGRPRSSSKNCSNNNNSSGHSKCEKCNGIGKSACAICHRNGMDGMGSAQSFHRCFHFIFSHFYLQSITHPFKIQPPLLSSFMYTHKP